MARLMYFIMIMSLSFGVFAAGAISQEEAENGQWVKDWWDNVYELRVEKAEENAEQKALTRCEQRLERYKQKIQEDPNSEYYKFKVESWEKRCEEEKK